MANGPKYPSSSGDWDESIRRANQMGHASEDLDRKERARQGTEERGQTVERRSTTERQSMADATTALTERLSANRSALEAENAALTLSVDLMARAVALRRQIAEIPLVSSGARAAASGVAAGGSGALAAAPIVGDPNAEARVAEARRAEADARVAVQRAEQQVRSVTRLAATGGGLGTPSPEFYRLTTAQQRALQDIEGMGSVTGSRIQTYRRLEQQGLVERVAGTPQGYQRTIAGQAMVSQPASGEQVALASEQLESARQNLTATKEGLRAAQASAEATKQVAALRVREMETLRQLNLAEEQERTQAEAAATARAAQAVGQPGLRQLPRGSYIEAGPIGSTGMGEFRAPYGPPRPVGPRGAPLFGVTSGGPADPTFLSKNAAYSGQTAGYTEEEATRIKGVHDAAMANETALARMGNTQAGVNREMAAANAVFADYSTRLSRHGALTTEFIQSFARGQVTLREFGEQMTSVMGKFGGWLVAGAAVYGVYEAFKHVIQGATETQAAVQQLGRFIPGLGGPAGGGKGQVGAAASTVRDISTQFNVPIKEVVDNMTVMARTFKSVADAGDATRALLAVSRLDLVPPETAQNYLIGIAQTGVLNPGGPMRGSDLIGLVNSLNAMQANFGARVAQTLPALARAAPAAYAAGVDTPTLETLVGMGVRAGIPGNQVGTALLRSLGTFATRPSSQITLREFGITPDIGQEGNVWKQVMGLIDRRERQGNALSGRELQRLAVSLGGPLLGTRTLLPMLVQEQLHPGLFGGIEGTVRHPRPYQEDLNAVLGTVHERFKSIGITLQNLGSQLEQAGALTPIAGLLNAFNLLAHVVEGLASPLSQVLGVVNELPGPMRDALGLFIAYRGARYLADTRFGGAAQTMLGRVPGLQFLRNEPQEAVQGIRTNLEREILPVQERDAEIASARMRTAKAAQQEAVGQREQFQALNIGASMAPAGSREYAEYQRVLGGLVERESNATSQALSAEVEFATAAKSAAKTQALINIAKDRQLTAAQRAAILEEEGWYQISESTNLVNSMTASFRARAQALGASGRAGMPPPGGASVAGVGAMEAATAAGAAVAVGAAVSELANNSSLQENLTRGMTQGGVILPPGAQRQAEREAQREAARAESAPFVYRPTSVGPETVTAAQMNFAESVRQAGGTWAALGSQLRDRGEQRLGEMAGFGGLGALGAGGSLGRMGRFMAGPGLPFAGIFGSQMLGDTIGGGVGSYISQVGGSAFGGMMIAQMLRPGSTNASLFGLGAGLLAGGRQAGGLAGGLTSGVGAGLLARMGLGSALTGLGLDIAAPEVGIPLTVLSAGAAALGFSFGSGGGQASPQDTANQGTRQAILNIRRAGLGARQANRFGDTFTNDLIQAALGSGQSSQKAQASVNATIQHLQAATVLYPGDSPQGKATKEAMNEVIGAAMAQATVDPATGAQIVQAVTQARNQEIQRQLQYGISTAGPGGGQAAARRAVSQYAAIAQPFTDNAGAAQQAVTEQEDALTQLQARAGSSVGDQRQRLERQVAAAKKRLAQTRNTASVYQSMATLAQQNATIQEQQAAQMGAQADVQDIQADMQLAVSRAGGSVMAQLRAQVTGARKTYDRFANDPNLDPRTRRNAMEQAQSQINDAHTRMAQQGLTQLQATGAVAAAQVFTGDPVGQARENLQNLRDQYNYMRQHSKAFDPSQIRQGLAAVISAEQQFAQTISDYNTQMIQLSTQLAQARAFGDRIAQAGAGVRGASRQLAAARTPVQRAQALLDVQNAQNAQFDAISQTIAAQNQLAQARASGDPLQQAALAIQGAQQLLGAAHGIDNVRQAEGQLATAQYAYEQALEQRYMDLANLRASAMVNPVQQLHAQLQGVGRALSVATRPQDRIQLRTQYNQMSIQYQQAIAQTTAETVNFQFQMMQISSQQAISQLQKLLRNNKDLTAATRQQLQEQIRQYQLGLVSPIGGGSGTFDLAPGNIRLPTYYDVAHAARSGRPGGVTQTYDNTFHVYVRRAEDVPKVAEVLDRATGGNMRARLRTAKVVR